MARFSVLGLLVAGALVAACFSVTTAPTDTPGSANPQTLAPQTPVATIAPPTAEPPTASPIPTLAATPTHTPHATPTGEPTTTPTEEPTRTLAPGETPQPTPMDISSFLTATLNVVNLTDFQTLVNVDIYDEGENQGSVASVDLEAYGSMFQAVLPGDYGVTFDPEGEAVTCLLTVEEGQEIGFTLVGEDILISDPQVPPTDPEDLFVETSSLCER